MVSWRATLGTLAGYGHGYVSDGLRFEEPLPMLIDILFLNCFCLSYTLLQGLVAYLSHAPLAI